MARLPWMKFFPADYLLDTQPLSAESRGVWMDLICHLWRSDPRGRLTLHVTQWTKLLRVTTKTFKETCNELTLCQICAIAVTENDEVTVSSRRILREEKTRKDVRLRVRRHRSNKKVTPLSRVSNREKSEAEVRSRSQKQDTHADVTPPVSELSASTGSEPEDGGCPKELRPVFEKLGILKAEGA